MNVLPKRPHVVKDLAPWGPRTQLPQEAFFLEGSSSASTFLQQVYMWCLAGGLTSL